MLLIHLLQVSEHLVSLDVNGHAELDDVNVSGAITATTFTGNLVEQQPLLPILLMLLILQPGLYQLINWNGN